MPFIRRLGLQGLLSFPPDMESFELQPLNVLIGPNGSGKTNLIEALELLRAMPTDFAAAIRVGGGAAEWLWKGENPARAAAMDVEIGDEAPSTGRPLRYRLEFTEVNNRVEVLDEAIEETTAIAGNEDVDFYYRFRRGKPVISVGKWTPDFSDSTPSREKKQIDRGDLYLDQSILSQRREPKLYPEITYLRHLLERIRTFRDWTFGASSQPRAPQRAEDPSDELLPGGGNLPLVLNEIQHRGDLNFNETMNRFLPRYERASTRIAGGSVQLYLHEQGLRDPIPATRVSDGTLRFLAMLVALHAPTPPPLLCIEEPELGMHPDAVALLAELLVEASSRMQLVVTTHSDALLSELGDKVESVLVCENDGHGTTIRRLDAERLAFWLKDYTLGDVWRIGEIGGNP